MCSATAKKTPSITPSGRVEGTPLRRPVLCDVLLGEEVVVELLCKVVDDEDPEEVVARKVVVPAVPEIVPEVTCEVVED